MATTAQPLIVCPDCGKKYKWLPHLVGRQVKCACGTAIRVDAEALGDTPPAAAAKSGAPVRSANPQVMSQALMDKLGVVPIKKSRVAEDDRADLEKQRVQLESITQPNFLRDVVIPIPIMVVGLILMFFEQMHFYKPAPTSGAEAITVVAIRAFCIFWNMAFWMTLSYFFLEIRFLGSIPRCLLRFGAIALGPCAFYGILAGAIDGDLAGSLSGVVVSVSGYAILLYLLMRMEIRDLSICTLITFISVTGANWTAYKIIGIKGGSWI